MVVRSENLWTFPCGGYILCARVRWRSSRHRGTAHIDLTAIFSHITLRCHTEYNIVQTTRDTTDSTELAKNAFDDDNDEVLRI